MEELIAINLTPKQAKQFVMMQFLDSCGIFDIRNGQVTINFDEQGTIRDVAVTNHYKAKESYVFPPIDKTF